MYDVLLLRDLSSTLKTIWNNFKSYHFNYFKIINHFSCNCEFMQQQQPIYRIKEKLVPFCKTLFCIHCFKEFVIFITLFIGNTLVVNLGYNTSLHLSQKVNLLVTKEPHISRFNADFNDYYWYKKREIISESIMSYL